MTKINWSGLNCDFLPKWITIWTWPIHFGHVHFILVVIKSLWSGRNKSGQTKTILDQPKLFWSHRRTRHKFKQISKFYFWLIWLMSRYNVHIGNEVYIWLGLVWHGRPEALPSLYQSGLYLGNIYFWRKNYVLCNVIEQKVMLYFLQ